DAGAELIPIDPGLVSPVRVELERAVTSAFDLAPVAPVSLAAPSVEAAVDLAPAPTEPIASADSGALSDAGLPASMAATTRLNPLNDAEGSAEAMAPEVSALEKLEAIAMSEAQEPAQVVKPGHLVSALVRLLIQKGILSETELIEELQRR
ncbi:MAG: hypothetical protein ACYCWW_20185, partial [Deltaproteobacteria bacterium]